jgi:hypothetical protein
MLSLHIVRPDGALWSSGQSAWLGKLRAEALWKKQESGEPTDEENPNATSGSGSNEFFLTRRDEELEGEKKTSKKTSR